MMFAVSPSLCTAGGFAAFSASFPNLCEQSAETETETMAAAAAARGVRNSHLKLSVISSLPVTSNRALSKPPSQEQLQCTPLSEDRSCGSRFGPPAELLPHLLLGCAKDSANVSLLRQLGVTAILNVSHNCPNHFESLFEYKTICVEDSHNADLLSVLNSAIEFIGTSAHSRTSVDCYRNSMP